MNLRLPPSKRARLLTKVRQIDAHKTKSMSHKYRLFKENPLRLIEKKIYENHNAKKIKKIL
jgi:hypothetical protein